MLSRLGVTLGALGLATGGLALGTPAQAEVRVGVMTCDMDSGCGYVLGSSRGLHCTFMPAAGAPEHYAGTTGRSSNEKASPSSSGLRVTRTIPPFASRPNSSSSASGFLMCS